MKYMLLIYDNPRRCGVLPRRRARRDLMARGRRDHGASSRESGELVGGEALADPSHAEDRARARRRRRRSPTGRTSRPRSTSPASTSSTARAPSARSRSPRAGPSARFTPVEVRPIMDARRRGDVSTDDRASRTCCASWRRRSSARSSAATGTSTRARTPCRRRCSPRRVQWPERGRAREPAGLADHGRVAPADRRAAQRARRAGAARTRPRRRCPPTSASRRARRRASRASTTTR